MTVTFHPSTYSKPSWWASPAMKRLTLLCVAGAALAGLYALREGICSTPAITSKFMSEAEMHQKGLWKSPRLGIDAFIVRHVRSSDKWEILLVQVRGCKH